MHPYLFWAMWKENLKILVVELSKKQVSRQKICCPSIAPRLYIMSNSSESIYLHILSFVVFHDYSLPWFISVDYIWFSYHKHFKTKNKPAFSVVYLFYDEVFWIFQFMLFHNHLTMNLRTWNMLMKHVGFSWLFELFSHSTDLIN